MDAEDGKQLCLRCGKPLSVHIGRNTNGAGKALVSSYCADLYGVFVSDPNLLYMEPLTDAEINELLTYTLHGPLPAKTVLRMMATLADVPALRRAAQKGQYRELK